MTKREYLKYNQEVYDKQDKCINIGDTVVINNHYGSSPYIGVVDHFTERGNVAILYEWKGYGHTSKCWAYRDPYDIVILKRGKKK